MAVRFTATTSYSSTLTAGAQANYTLAGWLNIQVDRNGVSTFLGLETSSGDYTYLQTTADGTTMRFNDSFGVGVNTIPLTVGTWYFVASSVVAGASTLYVRADSAATFTTAANTGGVGSVTLTTARIADSQFGEPLNASAAGVRVWSAALTQAELLIESRQLKPWRRANLVSAWLLSDASDLTDVSGSAHSLTGTSATDAAGPAVPVQWNRMINGTPDSAGYRASTW